MTLAQVDGKLRALGSMRFFALIAGPLLAIYLATGTYTPPYGIDRLSNALVAQSIGDHGTPFLKGAENLVGTRVAFVVPAIDGRFTSQYPPGAALWAAPFYVIDRSEPEVLFLLNGSPATYTEVRHPALWPATAAAALAVAIAMGLVGLTLRKLGPDAAAVGGAYVLGLATNAWAIAAESLWTHGPAMMWLALGIYLSASARWGSGLAFGAAILTRPITAIIGAASGIYQSWRERSVGAALKIGVGSAMGLVALVAYNAWVFGDPSISGGYSELFATEHPYLVNVLLGLVSPTRGLLPWAPFLVVLAFGVPAAWRAAPDWARAAAVGGAAYLAVHWWVNRYTGGGGFPGYRYPLEALVAMAPLLYLAFTRWVAHRPVAMRAFLYLVVATTTAQFVFAVGFGMRF